jgi:iron complex outermembrane recepter protein
MRCDLEPIVRIKLKILLVVTFSSFLSVSMVHAVSENKDKSNSNEEKVLDEIIFEAPKVELRDTFDDFMPLPTAKFKVKSQDIANTNAVTIEDTVRYSPNIEVRKRYIGDHNGVVSMRGNGNFQTARHMVFVDGFPLHSMLQTRWNGAPQWNFVAPDEAETITITYGPFSPKYSGNAMGGVIDIETRQPYQEEWVLKTTGWVHDWTHFKNEDTSIGYKTFFSYGNKQDKLSYYMFFNRLEGFVQPTNLQEDTSTSVADGSENAATGAFRFMDNRSRDSIGFSDDGEEKVENNILKIKSDYKFSDSFKLRGMLGYLIRHNEQLNVKNYLRNSSGIIWGGAGNTNISYGGRRFQIKASHFNVTTRDKQDLLLGLGAEGKIVRGWNYDMVLSSYIKLDDTYRSSDENPSDPNYDHSGSLTQFQDTGWQLLELKFNKDNFLNNANLKFEGGYHYDHARMETIKWNVSDWEHDEKDKGTYNSSTGGQTDTHAIHANLGWKFRPKWDLQMGGRLEAWRSFNAFEHESEGEIGGHDHVNEQAFSPKFSIGYKPNSEWDYQFSLARATRFPIPEEMFSNIDDYDDKNISNPGLKPEVGNHVTFMVSHYKPKGSTKLNLFFDYINDTIFNDNVTGFGTTSTFVNIDLVRTMGAEFVLKRKDFLIPKHDFSFNAAFTDAKILFYNVTPAAHGKDLPRVPDLRVKFQSVYHFLDNWDGMIAARWQDRMWGRLQNDDPLDGSGGHSEYLFLDVKTNYESKNFVSSFGVTNLTNETAWTGPHQFPNRTYVLDIKWKI